MRVLIRSCHLWIGVLLFTTFWITASFIPNDIVLLLTNTLYLTTSFFVAVAYIPPAIQSIRKQQASSIQHLCLGIVFSWAAASAYRAWTILGRMGGQDPLLVNNDVTAFLQSAIVYGGIYHLTSPGAAYNLGLRRFGPKGSRWVAVGSIVVISVLLAWVFYYLSPDLGDFAKMIAPYLPR